MYKNKVFVNKSVSEEFLNSIILSLGGINNILDVNEVGNRVSFDVVDVRKVNFEEFKKIAKSGVFVVNNSVKAIFEVDSKTLKNALKNVIDE